MKMAAMPGNPLPPLWYTRLIELTRLNWSHSVQFNSFIVWKTKNKIRSRPQRAISSLSVGVQMLMPISRWQRTIRPRKKKKLLAQRATSVLKVFNKAPLPRVDPELSGQSDKRLTETKSGWMMRKAQCFKLLLMGHTGFPVETKITQYKTTILS